MWLVKLVLMVSSWVSSCLATKYFTINSKLMKLSDYEFVIIKIIIYVGQQLISAFDYTAIPFLSADVICLNPNYLF